ncbi:MAG: hypothetical protein ACLU2X_07590 [Ruminococcus sp.]
MKYKVSGAIAIPKASWGCAPALPNRMQAVFLRRICSWENGLSHPAKIAPLFCLCAVRRWLRCPNCL